MSIPIALLFGGSSVGGGGTGGDTPLPFSDVAISANGQTLTIDFAVKLAYRANIADGVTDLTIAYANAPSGGQTSRQIMLNNISNDSNLAVIVLSGNWVKDGGVDMPGVPANGYTKFAAENNSDTEVGFFISPRKI